MSFSFIEKSNIRDAYKESQEYMRPLFEPFDEYERLARNKPHPKIPAHLPKVTEGTLSSTIIKQPRRVIQQLVAGKVKYEDDDGLEPVLQTLHENVYLPNAKTGGDVLQKSWQSTQNCLTYGSQPILSFYTRHGRYFGADMRLPYVKNVLLEKYQLGANDSNLLFLESWWTRSMLKSIVDQEEWLIKQSKERKDEVIYKSSWNLKRLSNLVNTGEQSKSEEQKTPAEKELGGEAGGYPLVTAMQNGVNAEFYTFLTDKESDDEEPIRTKVNPDPRGKMPITYQFHTVDGGNPLGRGAPEHSGAVQNMIDSYLQMTQYNFALRNAPPLKKWGNLDNSKVKIQPDWIIDMGPKGDADVEPMTIAPQSSGDFQNNYGVMKGILLTGTNGMDTSISAEAGNPGFSKTSAGVKNQEHILGVDDNYIRKQYETAWGDVFETGLNIQISEGRGKEELLLSEEQIEKLSAIYPEVKENGGRLNVLYDRIENDISFEVDLGTSAGDDDQSQIEILDGIVDKYSSNQLLQARLDQEGYDFSLGETFDRIIKKSGVQDPEKLIHKLSPEEIAAKQEEQAMAAAAAGVTNPNMPAGAEGEMPTEAPIDATGMLPQSQEEPGLDLTPLMDAGLSDEQIDSVLTQLQNPEADLDVILSQLGGAA